MFQMGTAIFFNIDNWPIVAFLGQFRSDPSFLDVSSSGFVAMASAVFSRKISTSPQKVSLFLPINGLNTDNSPVGRLSR